MSRVAATLLVLPLLASCGTEARLDPATAQQMGEARQQAEEAQQAVAALKDQVASLESRLNDRDETSKAARARTTKVVDRLWASLAKVRQGLRDAAGSADDAAGAAASALAEAQAATKELSVLQDRFDYHLTHGNG
jgi:chromosome segregation ATPase